MNAVAATNHTTSRTSSTVASTDENPPPPGDWRVWSWTAAVDPSSGAVQVRACPVFASVGVDDGAGERRPQRDGEGAGRRGPGGCDLGRVRRAADRGQQVGVGEGVEPAGEGQLTAQRRRGVLAVGADDPFELHADERRPEAVQHVGGLGRRCDRVGEHDAQAAVLGRRRAVDGPPGGLGVVEPQVGGQAGGLRDDLGVGDHRHRHGARPVGADHDVDGGVDVTRRQQQHGDDTEQQADGAAVGHPDRMADRPV